MNWFYSKDGQQAGPVAFSEIERLYGAGELTADSLVWQQGTPNWVKLSTVLAPPAALSTPAASAPASPAAPAAAVPGIVAPLPDYGDILCWGIIAILIPCIGWLAIVPLIILHFIEYFAVRKAVEEGRLTPSEYSRLNPALYIIGLLCCGLVLYPLFMHFRSKAGCFRPQPQAVMIAIIVVVLFLLGYTGWGVMNSSHSFQFTN